MSKFNLKPKRLSFDDWAEEGVRGPTAAPLRRGIEHLKRLGLVSEDPGPPRKVLRGSKDGVKSRQQRRQRVQSLPSLPPLSAERCSGQALQKHGDRLGQNDHRRGKALKIRMRQLSGAAADLLSGDYLGEVLLCSALSTCSKPMPRTRPSTRRSWMRCWRALTLRAAPLWGSRDSLSLSLSLPLGSRSLTRPCVPSWQSSGSHLSSQLSAQLHKSLRTLLSMSPLFISGCQAKARRLTD